VMVREGFRAEKEENGRDIPDINDMQLVLNIRRDYRLIADDIHEELRRCFGVKKKKSFRTKKTIPERITRLISRTFRLSV
ncbi:MAG: hypothetical protein K2O40_07675, partial [Lachnospiraceae bacterium]|nr:hypothetical protein [Lachnospiraceae bacterium]